jgi:hypothetical protein
MHTKIFYLLHGQPFWITQKGNLYDALDYFASNLAPFGAVLCEMIPA